MTRVSWRSDNSCMKKLMLAACILLLPAAVALAQEAPPASEPAAEPTSQPSAEPTAEPNLDPANFHPAFTACREERGCEPNGVCAVECCEQVCRPYEEAGVALENLPGGCGDCGQAYGDWE